VVSALREQQRREVRRQEAIQELEAKREQSQKVRTLALACRTHTTVTDCERPCSCPSSCPGCCLHREMKPAAMLCGEAGAAARCRVGRHERGPWCAGGAWAAPALAQDFARLSAGKPRAWLSRPWRRAARRPLRRQLAPAQKPAPGRAPGAGYTGGDDAAWSLVWGICRGTSSAPRGLWPLPPCHVPQLAQVAQLAEAHMSGAGHGVGPTPGEEGAALVLRGPDLGKRRATASMLPSLEGSVAVPYMHQWRTSLGGRGDIPQPPQDMGVPRAVRGASEGPPRAVAQPGGRRRSACGRTAGRPQRWMRYRTLPSVLYCTSTALYSCALTLEMILVLRKKRRGWTYDYIVRSLSAYVSNLCVEYMWSICSVQYCTA